MRIVGLDLSLTCSGWAEFTGMTLAQLTWGVFKTPAKLNGLARLQWVREQVWQLVSSDPAIEPENAGLVVLEDFSLGSQGAYVAETHGLGWMVRDWLQQGGFPYTAVSPQSLKKFVAGNVPQGERKKEVIIREVFKRWNVDANDNNMADAVVLVQIGRALVGELEVTAPYQRDVITNLRKNLLPKLLRADDRPRNTEALTL